MLYFLIEETQVKIHQSQTKAARKARQQKKRQKEWEDDEQDEDEPEEDENKDEEMDDIASDDISTPITNPPPLLEIGPPSPPTPPADPTPTTTQKRKILEPLQNQPASKRPVRKSDKKSSSAWMAEMGPQRKNHCRRG